MHYLVYFHLKYFRSQFRTLIAGGGTDGGVAFMAEQLNHTYSEVVYFDFSIASMSVAQYRAKFRGYLKIVWVIDWIESIPRLGLGAFDLAVSTGVLHHLKNPQNALNIVNDIQLPHGGADIMVYGTYGRTTIYWIQEVLRILNEREHDINDELRNARHLLEILPNDHLFNTLDLADHKTMGDIGIYDLLLHKRDVSFTTLTMYQWLQNSGYNVVDFAHPEYTIPISLKTILNEKWLLDKIYRSSMPMVYEIGEIIYGKVIKHDLYVSKKLYSEANLDMLNDTVVYAYGSPMGFRAAMNNKENYRKLRNETYVFSTLMRSHFDEVSNKTTNIVRKKSGNIDGNFVWPLTKFNTFMLDSLIKKPIRPIHLSSMINKFKVETKTNITIEEGKNLFGELYAYIKDTRMFFLKHKFVQTFPLTCCSSSLYTVGNGNTTLIGNEYDE